MRWNGRFSITGKTVIGKMLTIPGIWGFQAHPIWLWFKKLVIRLSHLSIKWVTSSINVHHGSYQQLGGGNLRGFQFGNPKPGSNGPTKLVTQKFLGVLSTILSWKEGTNHWCFHRQQETICGSLRSERCIDICCYWFIVQHADYQERWWYDYITINRCRSWRLVLVSAGTGVDLGFFSWQPQLNTSKRFRGRVIGSVLPKPPPCGPYVYPFSSWKPGQSWLSPAEVSHYLHCRNSWTHRQAPAAPQWRLSRGLARVLPVESLSFLSLLMIKLGIWGSTCISHFHGPKTVPNNEQDSA